MGEEQQVDLQAVLRELHEERSKRVELEKRVQEVSVEREIRAELERLGVAKVDLAYRAVRDDLKSSTADERREYLAQFVGENPELMPARVAGGSGASSGQKSSPAVVDLDKIRPGMSREEMERVRQEIARVASLTLRGF